MRIQKYLAHCGIASRRAAESLVADEQVFINGKLAHIGQLVAPGDRVTYLGQELTPQTEYHYVLLNKPVGYITAVKDQFGRPTVTDLVPIPGLYPVGRLDYNTSGLLLLTNDGDLAYKLTHPKFETPKTYWLRIKGKLPNDALKQLTAGVIIDGDYRTRPAQVHLIHRDNHSTQLTLTLKEGKNRQVRKMVDAIGHRIITLKRESTMGITLEGTPEGEYRHLKPHEIHKLKQLS